MIAPQHPSLSDPGALGSDTILSRLMQLHPKVIDLSLGRTQDLLDRLGRPQDRLPPVVHVAGTNGKGSTIATLRAIAQAAGYRVHVYTSPHLSRFHERIRLAGRLIHEEALQALLSDCESVNEGRPITFFEITTCAAFKAFSETPGDLLLLETGLGGRLDSTNVVDHPAATIITPISMDHIQFLGDNTEIWNPIGHWSPGPGRAAGSDRLCTTGGGPLAAAWVGMVGRRRGGWWVSLRQRGLVWHPATPEPARCPSASQYSNRCRRRAGPAGSGIRST